MQDYFALRKYQSLNPYKHHQHHPSVHTNNTQFTKVAKSHLRLIVPIVSSHSAIVLYSQLKLLLLPPTIIMTLYTSYHAIYINFTNNNISNNKTHHHPHRRHHVQHTTSPLCMHMPTTQIPRQKALYPNQPTTIIEFHHIHSTMVGLIQKSSISQTAFLLHA